MSVWDTINKLVDEITRLNKENSDLRQQIENAELARKLTPYLPPVMPYVPPTIKWPDWPCDQRVFRPDDPIVTSTSGEFTITNAVEADFNELMHRSK